jgi:hypothetical protein
MNPWQARHCLDGPFTVIIFAQQAPPVLEGWRCAIVASLLALLLVACGATPESSTGEQLHVSCLEKPDTGVCRAGKPAFYYDYPTDSCQRFVWGGCGGKVPFQSMDQCVKTCGGRPAP